MGASSPELWHIIQQAIVGYKIPAGRGLLAEAGIFVSPIGIEGIAIKDNWNWSRSNLFFALPFYHAGVRLTYPVSDHVTAAAYVTNGWNDIVNRNRQPCVAGLVTWIPSDKLTGTLLYFGGVEPFLGAPEGQPWRHLFDVNATVNVASSLSFAFQADAGFEQNNFGTSWWGTGALYARVQPASWLFIAARGDYLHEHAAQDAMGTASRLFFPADDVMSGTLTADVRPVANLSLRLEYRYDHASADMFFQNKVPTDMNGADVPNARDQQTVTAGAVAWF